MDTVEKNISLFIQSQFPEFYRSEGAMFIDFVTEYYRWMESETPRKIEYICEDKSSIAVTHNSANIVGTNTFFTENYANGDQIAICKSAANSNFEYEDYEVFTIDTVTNNSFLTLTTDKLPSFAYTATRYGQVNTLANPLYYARRMPEIKDVDATLDEFLVYYKEKYLKNIQFATETNTKTLVKNSLDIYRSKGTPRGIDLLFRIVFGTGADVYYPSTDLLRASDGVWFQPTYLEVIPTEVAVKFINKQIKGITSGATAFVENVIRRTVNGKIIDVIYISAINGNFQTNEKINVEDGTVSVDAAPYIVGSLNSIVISGFGIGSDFSIGDTLRFESINGREAEGRVVDVADAILGLDYQLLDGGYGYSNSTANVLISEQMLVVDGLQYTPAEATATNARYFAFRERFQQPLANVTYNNANGGFDEGEAITAYYANNDVAGTGTVTIAAPIDSNTGTFQTTIESGTMDADFYGNAANAVGANQQGGTGANYLDLTANGDVLGAYANISLFVTDITGTFSPNEEVYQDGYNSVGTFSSFSNTIGSNAVFNLSDVSTTPFVTGERLIGRDSGAEANVQTVALTIGLVLTNGSFVNTPFNYCYFDFSAKSAQTNFVGLGTGFTFNYSSNLIYTEIIELGTDTITANGTHYGPIALNATQYDFPADPSGNLTSNTIDNMLSTSNTEIGKIQTIVGLNQGSDYNITPLVRIVEPGVFAFQIPDNYDLEITGAVGPYEVGELVTQASSNARGLVLEGSTANNVYIQRLRFEETNWFVPTVNATTVIVGDSSGVTSNIVTISELANSLPLGNDVEFTTQLVAGNNSIVEIEVTDSGFGFVNSDTVTVYDSSNNALSTTVIGQNGGPGQGAGYYKRIGGFLSDRKKLQGGPYWQTYSYEVRSQIILDRYKDMLNEVMHVAGTTFFGNLVYTSVLSNPIDVDSSIVITP